MTGRLSITLATAIFLAFGTSARAQDVALTLICDLGGAPARMTMAVQYQQAFDYSADQRGNISGVFPVGVTVYTAGQVISQSAGYTFRGENQFADFTTMGSNERFRVQWQLDPQRNGLWMIVNPFGSAARHFCRFQGTQ